MRSLVISGLLCFGTAVLFIGFLSERLSSAISSRTDASSSSSNNSNTTKSFTQILLEPNKEHRLAILLPFVTHGTAGVAAALTYLPAFCTGAAGAADIADFLVPHTGVLDDWPFLRTECPSNVIFIHLGSHQALAERLLRVMDEPQEYNDDMHNNQEPPSKSRTELHAFVTEYLKQYPYALVEFKPALGHIFAQEIENYSHWGYSDFDILFGDLGRWITQDELTDFDIVTYSFGDQGRLYLRGQFTFHKNRPETINQLWRGCDYLTKMDERFDQIVKKEKDFHMESAEGCYSAAVLDQTNVKVKFAVKAWTDISSEDTSYSHGIFLSRSKSGRQVLYKADPAQLAKSGFKVSRLQPEWFNKDDAVYMDRTTLIQRQVGQREAMEHSENPDANCMYWVLPKYQSKLCLSADVSRDDTVYWIDGKLYKQRYENAQLDSGVLTAPFFHFQEWKRSYRYGQLSTMYPSSPIQTFALVPEGAIPMIEGKTHRHAAASPLGLSDVTNWTGAVSQLPGHTYCLRSDGEKNGRGTYCKRAISWQNHTTILSQANGWQYLHMDEDVTLVLTLQISASQVKDMAHIQKSVDVLKLSLDRWQTQPCVVVVSVSGATEEAKTLLRKSFGSVSQAALVAAIYEHSDQDVSRKALLNLAIDAVPTRWYISGLEIERGLSISSDTAFFAHRTAQSHNRLRGNILMVPQFGLSVAQSDEDKALMFENPANGPTLKELSFARRKRKLKDLSSFEKTCDEEDAPIGIDNLASLEIAWWVETVPLFEETVRTKQGTSDVTKRVSSVEDVQHGILELATGDHGASMLSTLSDSPIFLTDNLGPHEGIRTHEIVREVETFVGPRCFNGMKIKQLAILGYNFDTLAGAFATSSESSRDMAQSGREDESRCHGCSAFTVDQYELLNTLAKVEIKRVAKTAILWAESLGEKK